MDSNQLHNRAALYRRMIQRVRRQPLLVRLAASVLLRASPPASRRVATRHTGQRLQPRFYPGIALDNSLPDVFDKTRVPDSPTIHLDTLQETASAAVIGLNQQQVSRDEHDDLSLPHKSSEAPVRHTSARQETNHQQPVPAQDQPASQTSSAETSPTPIDPQPDQTTPPAEPPLMTASHALQDADMPLEPEAAPDIPLSNAPEDIVVSSSPEQPPTPATRDSATAPEPTIAATAPPEPALSAQPTDEDCTPDAPQPESKLPELFAPTEPAMRSPQAWARRLGLQPESTHAQDGQQHPTDALSTVARRVVPTTPAMQQPHSSVLSEADWIARTSQKTSQGTSQASLPAETGCATNAAEHTVPQPDTRTTTEDWARRLFAAHPDPAVEPTAAMSAPDLEALAAADFSSEPLTERTRRFLHPLTGIDPADVPLLRGVLADILTSHAQADALAIGDTIVLGAGHTEHDPQTLGVLAHELTHIARARQPRFLPPVLRSPVQTGMAPVQPQAAPETDEETLAGSVEALVQQHARYAAPAAQPESHTTRTPHRDDHISALVPEPQPADSVGRSWNGVPAPWEALPSWMQAPAEKQPDWQADQPLQIPNSQAVPRQDESSNALHRADRERSLPHSYEPRSAASHTEQQPQPTPDVDLDALAREVYKVLRRRLAAEARRLQR